MEGWRNRSFPTYEKLVNIFGKDRATRIGAQTPIDMVEDLNVENENDHILDVPSPMSVNSDSEPATPSQSIGRKRTRSKDDIARLHLSCSRTLLTNLISLRSIILSI